MLNVEGLTKVEFDPDKKPAYPTYSGYSGFSHQSYDGYNDYDDCQEYRLALLNTETKSKETADEKEEKLDPTVPLEYAKESLVHCTACDCTMDKAEFQEAHCCTLCGEENMMRPPTESEIAIYFVKGF